MKTILKKAAIVAASLLAMAGCQEKYPDPSYVVGVIEGDFTRTEFKASENKFKGTWNGGDVISIVTANAKIEDSSDHIPYGFYMASDTGLSVAFMQMDEYMAVKAPYVAYYPSDLMSLELPAVQKYCGADPADVPMMAKSPTMYLEFKPICGLMEIKLATALEDVKVESLRITADQPLSGGFYVDDDYNAVALGNAEVTLDCGSGVALGKDPVTFWVSLPPATYSNIRIKMNATDGRTQEFSLKEGVLVNVLRGRITSCPIDLGSLIPTDAEDAYLPVGADFNVAIKAIANPEMPANSFDTNVTDSTILRIEFVTCDTDASGKRISYGEVPVYASFDSRSGVMKVSTPAKRLHTSSDCGCMFRYMAALETVNLEMLETDGLADISYMFNHCHNLKNVDVSKLNTSAVRTMDNAFSYSRSLLALDLSNWDTGNVMNMRSLFNNLNSITSIDASSFRTEKCTLMSYMFQYCTSLEELDISGFDLRNIKGADLNYHLFRTPSLRSVRLGAGFIPNDSAAPSSFFISSSTVTTARTGYRNGEVTFHTTQEVADWLAKTNLRWIRSGYKNQTAIPVHFIDINTGAKLNVTWAAN